MVLTDKELNNLKLIQDTEIKMLIELDRICRKYSLKYYVAGGTLLGVVRHNDFIPWDDDIDIDLKRDDFNKLLEVLPNELSSEYEFINYNEFDNKFCDFIPRIYYNNCKVKNNFRSKDGKNNLVNNKRIDGIFIELYCLHTTNSSNVKKQILKTKIIYGLAMGHRHFRFDSNKYSALEKIEVFALSTIGKMINMKAIFKLYEKNCNKISSNSGDLYFKPSVPLPVQEKNVFHKELFSENEYHKMRYTSVSVPKRYEDVLESLYGDWKSLPPESERKPSHFDLKDVEIY